MTGLAKRWVNDVGEVWELETRQDNYARMLVLMPIAGDPDRRWSVKREDLEDHRGWKPAIDHHGWKPSALHGSIGFPVEPTRCRYVCGTCSDICTRHNNEHGRHYHSRDRRGCPAAVVEIDGYALERAKDGDWSFWLPPSLMPRVSPDNTLMRGGQVWACRSLNSDAAVVVRLHEVGVPMVLARRDVPGADLNFFSGAPYACKAILVQQPDEPEPRLPSELFAIPGPNDPVEPHPTAGLPDDIYVKAMTEMIKNAQRSLDADLVKVFTGADIGAPLESAALDFENWRSGQVEADQARLSEAIKRRLMMPSGDFLPSYGLPVTDLPKKEATINGHRYSFTSMEILIDGKPLKLDGIKSINYEPVQDARPKPYCTMADLLKPTKLPSFFDIETDDRLTPGSSYLRSFDYGSFHPPQIMLPPDVYDKARALLLEDAAEQAPAGYQSPELKKLKVRREISMNGRDWCNYDMLIDADPWGVFKFRRLVWPDGRIEMFKDVPLQETEEWQEYLEEEKEISSCTNVENAASHFTGVDLAVPGSDRTVITRSCSPILAGGIWNLRGR